MWAPGPRRRLSSERGQPRLLPQWAGAAPGQRSRVPLPDGHEGGARGGGGGTFSVSSCPVPPGHRRAESTPEKASSVEITCFPRQAQVLWHLIWPWGERGTGMPLPWSPCAGHGLPRVPGRHAGGEGAGHRPGQRGFGKAGKAPWLPSALGLMKKSMIFTWF